jgi:hypothetical protein
VTNAVSSAPRHAAQASSRRPIARWEEPPVHPANNAPPMSDAELAELAADIKAHGMHEPIVLWRDNTEEANGAEGPFPLYLLDGRNRLAALKLLGVDNPRQARFGDLGIDTVVTLKAVKEVSHLRFGGGKLKSKWETDCDPVAFHQSMNVYRRHLTPEQRRELIAARLKENPARPNRQIGRILKVDHKTVAAVRRKEEDVGNIPHVDKVVDTKGRKQPTRKATAKTKPAVKPEAADQTHKASGHRVVVGVVGTTKDLNDRLIRAGLTPLPSNSDVNRQDDQVHGTRKKQCVDALAIIQQMRGLHNTLLALDLWTTKKHDYAMGDILVGLNTLQQECEDTLKMIEGASKAPPAAPGALVWTKDQWGNHVAELDDSRNYCIGVQLDRYHVSYLDRAESRDGPNRKPLATVTSLDAAMKVAQKHHDKLKAEAGNGSAHQ